MNTNETDTSSVSGAFGTVTHAGNPAPRKSMPASRKLIENPTFPFNKAVTPKLTMRLRPTEWKILCGSYLTKKLLYVRYPGTFPEADLCERSESRPKFITNSPGMQMPNRLGTKEAEQSCMRETAQPRPEVR